MKSDITVNLGAVYGSTEYSGDADAAYDGKDGQEVGACVHGIRSGFYVDVTDQQGYHELLLITEAQCYNLGTTLHVEDPKN